MAAASDMSPHKRRWGNFFIQTGEHASCATVYYKVWFCSLLQL